MYGIDRFSKKSFLDYCADRRAKLLANLKLDSASLDGLEQYSMLDQLLIGKVVMLDQLIVAIQDGKANNESGRFSKNSISEYVHSQAEQLVKAHKFDVNNGYSQLSGKPLDVIKSYVVFDGLRDLYSDLGD